MRFEPSSERWRGVLAEIERAATRAGRHRSGRCSIEGTRLHERALRAGVRVAAALVGEAYAADRSPRIRGLLAQLERSGSALHIVADPVIQTLTEGRDIGAIVGLVPIPVAPRLDDLLRGNVPDPAPILAAVDVEDPGNVGALVRTALGCGALAFAAVGVSDAFHPRAVRTSMGSLFRLPLLRYPNVEALLADLRRLGVEALGAVSRDGEPLPGLALQRRSVAVLLGPESFGLGTALRASVDRLVTIPMGDAIDSLSVNAAAAILLYEIVRRRQQGAGSASCAPDPGTVG